MDYRKGFNIKPEKILNTGRVIFTNGTDEILPNQIACEAYGYTYNSATGTCDAFKYNTTVARKFDNVLNNTSGGSTENGTKDTILNGQENTTKGDNYNNIINGQKQELAQGVKNSIILSGKYGIAENQGEVVIGGGGFNEALGMAQTSFIQQSGNTTDNTETALLVQYLPLTYIQKVANCILGFEAHVIGVNTGVGDGSAGDYGYFKLTGGVKFTNGLASYYHVDVSAVVPHGHSGLNLTGTMKDVTATSFGVHVTGLAETYIQWTADIKLWRNNIQQTF
tara:strand:+ start:907 stop:1746 length:840 start_codon:yes stop_codon:yes gene_type:complete